MGNSQSTQKINFEDLQFVLKNPESYRLINTINNKILQMDSKIRGKNFNNAMCMSFCCKKKGNLLSWKTR